MRIAYLESLSMRIAYLKYAWKLIPKSLSMRIAYLKYFILRTKERAKIARYQLDYEYWVNILFKKYVFGTI